jgi:hypothetical protein
MADPTELDFLQGATPIEETPEESFLAGATPIADNADFLAGAQPIEASSLVSSTGETKGNLEAFALGAKEQLAPFQLSTQEYKANSDAATTDKSELASRVAGNITASILGGAAAQAAGGYVGGVIGGALGSVVPVAGTTAGALTGAALGRAAGMGLFALYSGLGKESARSQAEGKIYNPLSARSAMSVVTELNPLAKYGGKFLPTLMSQGIARASVQAMAEGGWEYSHSEDAKTAVLMGAIGTAFAAPSIISAARTPSASKAAASSLASLEDVLKSDTGLEILAKSTKRAATEATPADINDLDFKKWVLQMPSAKPETIESEFKRKTAKWNAGNFEEAWKAKQFQEIMAEEASAARQSMSREIQEHGVHDSTTMTGRKFKDAKFVARDADMVTGLNMEGMLDDFSAARNVHNFVTMGYIKPAEVLAKKARKMGLSGTDIGYALGGLEDKISPKGRALLATKEGQELLNGKSYTVRSLTGKTEERYQQGWRDLFNGAKDYMIQNGYDVGHLDNYLPMYSLRGADLGIAIEKAKIKLSNFAGEAGTKDISTLAQPEAQSLLKELNAMSEHTGLGNIKSLDDLDALRRSMMGIEKSSTGYELSALLARRGTMPELMRNFDVNDLFLQYLNGNMKSVHFDKAFRSMDANIGVLDALGMNETAKYFSKLSRDIAGADSGWVANMNRKIEDMRFSAEKALLTGTPSAWDRHYASAIKGAPEMVSFMTNMVYPSFLGLNMKAAIRNFFQPLMVTAPELGHGYGEKIVTQATLRAGYNKLKGGVDMEDFLQKKGLLGERFHGEALTSEAGHIGGTAKELIGKAGNASMWLYGKSDGINRYVTYLTGQQWAKDVIKGDKGALIALNRASTGVKAAIKAAGAEADPEKLGDLLGRYLISKTQFNYGKEQLNEVGREYGRLLSMFTKWPVMVGSDITEQFNKYGAKKGGYLFATKYMAPLMALTLVGKYLLDVDKNPTAKYLIGNPSQYAPLSSMQGVLSGQLGSPLLRTGMDTLSGFYDLATDTSSGKKDKAVSGLKRGIRETATTFLPGAAVINELDRYRTAHGKKKVSDQLLEELGFPRSNKP